MSKNETNEIKVDGNGNIILQGIHNSQITIDSSNSEDILSKLNQLENKQLDALSQIVTKDDLGQLFQTLLAGFIIQKDIVKGSISNVTGDVIVGDNNTRNYYFITKTERKKSKELNLNLPILRVDQIVGREKDLEDLHLRLFNKKHVVLVNGMGGIGKTTLAQVYLTKYYEEYKYILWVGLNPEEADFEADFIRTEGLLARLGVNPTGKTIQQSFAAGIAALQELDGSPCLLVIDNASTNLASYYDYLPSQPNWHILATSRQQIPYFDLKELGFLEEPEAVELFEKHYTHKKLSPAFLIKLVKDLEYHTLTIEILAKTAQEQRSAPSDLLNAIQNDLEVDMEGVRHSKDKIVKLTSYLCSIFTTSSLTENEKWLLQQFVCLPAEFHSYDLLEDLISAKESLSFNLAKTLNFLAKKGWLLYNKEADSYKIHRIIIDVVKVSVGLEEEDVEGLLKITRSKLSIDRTKDNPTDKFQWVPYGKAILIQFEASNSLDISRLQNNLATTLQDLGDYLGAKILLEKAKISAEKNFGESHPETIITYSNLAIALKALGNYEGAKVLLTKAMRFDEKEINKDYNRIIINHYNLGSLYQTLGDYQRAKVLLEKAKLLNEENFGINNVRTSMIYSKLATILQDLGDYEKAKKFNEAFFEEDHPRTTEIYSNLGVLLKALKSYEDAKVVLEKVVTADEKNFGKTHPHTATSYFNLGLVLHDLGNHKEAKVLLEKTYKIFKNHLGNNHHYTKIIKGNLDYVISLMNK